ncbi:MAG: AMP-binding protein [Candidatus Eremiobacteraeota bacterium]|nr:AMP-binding protein [Candidatus Eremiobacteraeota bacterium]
MRQTGHVDTFAEDHLPPIEQMPEFLFDGLPVDYPQRLNAAGYFLDRHVEAGGGDDRCIVEAGGATWSYAQLLDAANRIARVLVDDLGLESGNRVLLRAPNCAMLAASWFAVLKAGGVAVTTMPLYRAGELRFMIERAAISHVLCDARLRVEIERACGGSAQIAYFNGERDNASLERRMATKTNGFQNVRTAAQDVAIIAFTSGTTGTPKAAMHYHRDLLAICDTYAARVLEPTSNDLFCGSPPLGFTFGLGGLLLFPLHAGAATVLLEKAGPKELLEAVTRFEVTTLFTAPIAYRAMAGALEGSNLSSLRVCISAGEALPQAVWELWRAKTGIRILDGIGSTEMLHIFIGSPRSDVRPGSTGRVVPGYVAQIHDDDGHPVPDGTIGRVAVKGPTGCKYLDDDRQRAYVQHGWNYPGDAYRKDADDYFWYVARMDDIIVSAGYNIAGPEVEQALLAHGDVKEVAVIGKRDAEKETQLVKAFVVLIDGCAATPEKAEELRDFCASRIAAFKAPREIEFVHELPRTETGKVQRYKLRAGS